MMPMVFFLKSRWEAQGRAQHLVLELPLLFYSLFSLKNTSAAQNEAWKKRGFGVACSPTFWRVRGKGEFSMVLCNPLGSWSHLCPWRGKQTPRGCEAGQLCPGKEQCLCSQTEASLIFPGTLTIRWKGSWRYSQGFQPHERAGTGIHLCKSILRATIAQKSPVSGNWGLRSWWGHIHPHRVFKS